MQREPNYGRHREPGDGLNGGTGGGTGLTGGTMSARDEQTWSILSHLSVLAGLAGLMPLGALVIWLIYRDRSPRVRFHALQALWYQVAWLVIWVLLSLIGMMLIFITLGLGVFLVAPLAFLIWLAPLAHGCYAAYRVSRGADYRYPLVADWVAGRRGPV